MSRTLPSSRFLTRRASRGLTGVSCLHRYLSAFNVPHISTLTSDQGRCTSSLPHGTSLFLPRIASLAHIKGSVRRCIQVTGATPPPPCASRQRSLLSVFLFSRCTVSHRSSDIHVLLEAENELTRGRNRYLELFTVARNRRASLASFIVMFM